jgi:hypothetical protein
MDPAILDALPLRPIDLCRLGLVCRGLRDSLASKGAEGLWRDAAVRSWGPTGVRSWATAAAHARTSMEFDETVAFGSTVHAGSQGWATLRLGSALPYRIAAATGSVPVSSDRTQHASHTVEWSVTVARLPDTGASLWIGVMFDARGSDTGGTPRRLHRCSCAGASQHEGRRCELRGGTIWDALRPFSSHSERRDRPGLMNRWSDLTNWQICAIGSTGWVWGATIGCKLVSGMPTFSQGDVVHVSLHLPPKSRCSISFAVNSNPWVTAVRQLFPSRSTPQPVYFYPIVHLTDVAQPLASADLPVEASVQIQAAVESA